MKPHHLSLNAERENVSLVTLVTIVTFMSCVEFDQTYLMKCMYSIFY